MECYPPCKVCNGLCQKPVPERATIKRETRTKPVAPVHMPGYIVLICGAYTTLQEQLLVPGFRKTKRRYWCEKHQHWCNAYTVTERIEKLKEEPLF